MAVTGGVLRVAFRVGFKLFFEEEAALGDFVNQAAKSVLLFTSPRDNPFDFFTVGELDVGARSVDHQFPREAAGELVFIIEQ